MGKEWTLFKMILEHLNNSWGKQKWMSSPGGKKKNSIDKTFKLQKKISNDSRRKQESIIYNLAVRKAFLIKKTKPKSHEV